MLVRLTSFWPSTCRKVCEPRARLAQAASRTARLVGDESLGRKSVVYTQVFFHDFRRACPGRDHNCLATETIPPISPFARDSLRRPSPGEESFVRRGVFREMVAGQLCAPTGTSPAEAIFWHHDDLCINDRLRRLGSLLPAYTWASFIGTYEMNI